MTNLDSVLKSRGITLLTKVCIVRAMVFPVVVYGCESWTVKKIECWKIDAFKLWCWRRLFRVPWTVRRSNQSILKEINPEYSLEGLMLKLKLQYLGHLIRWADSLEKTLVLGKIEDRRRGGRERMRWLYDITDSMGRSLSEPWEIVKEREAWRAAVHGVAKNPWLSDWTATATRGSFLPTSSSENVSFELFSDIMPLQFRWQGSCPLTPSVLEGLSFKSVNWKVMWQNLNLILWDLMPLHHQLVSRVLAGAEPPSRRLPIILREAGCGCISALSTHCQKRKLKALAGQDAPPHHGPPFSWCPRSPDHSFARNSQLWERCKQSSQLGLHKGGDGLS